MQMRTRTRCEQANVDLRQPKTSSMKLLCTADCTFPEKKAIKYKLVGKRSGSLRCYSYDEILLWFYTNMWQLVPNKPTRAGTG